MSQPPPGGGGDAGTRQRLEALLGRALAAVDAEAATARVWESLALPEDTPLHVLALGKAGAAMARAIERVAGPRIRRGLVVTKDGHGLDLERFVLRESGHPVPDQRSQAAAHEALALASAVPPDELLLVLLSGGASALTTAPLPGLTLEDLAATTAALLACGADIEALNAVRKHTTALSGGRLAAASPARRVEVLAISDVAGDRFDVIGSGPAAADPTRFADALAVLRQYTILDEVPSALARHLEAGVRGRVPESTKPGTPGLSRVRHTLVASNRDARAAILRAGRELGLSPIDLGEVLRGEARRAGQRLARLARALRGGPQLLVAGGETTVTLHGQGRGGRSQELALAAALELEGAEGVALLAAGSDGSDGPTDAAGAFVDGGTLGRGVAAGLDARAALAENDAYTFFAGEGGLLVTGPTRTNVMDLVLVSAP